MGHGAGAGGGKAWDESDEEEESGGLKEEFEEADRRLAEDRIVQREKEKERGGETDFPSLTNGASHGPAKSSLDRADSASESSTQLEDQKTKSPSAILPTSPPISNTIPSPPLIASETQLDKTEQPWRNKRPPSSASPAPKAIETSGRSGPLHPIQAGRNGPIGLANPPLPGPEPDAVPVHEPRVRKEIRVREGGGNDMSSLASRVKNLVIDNQKGGSPRVRKAQSEKT